MRLAQVSSTEAKHDVAGLVHRVERGSALVAMRHDRPAVVLVPLEDYESLAGADARQLDTLTVRFDAELAAVNAPDVRLGTKRGFTARLDRPEILVIAGVNGAGKSSVAGARMRNAGGQSYDLDLHARQLLRGAAASHEIHVLFVGLDSPERHIARVAARVQAGGHDIAEARIRARFISSRATLIGLMPVLASLRLYDNSIEVASGGTSIPLPVRLLELEHGVITYEAPRGSIPGWAKAIVQAARDHARDHAR